MSFNELWVTLDEKHENFCESCLAQYFLSKQSKGICYHPQQNVFYCFACQKQILSYHLKTQEQLLTMKTIQNRFERYRKYTFIRPDSIKRFTFDKGVQTQMDEVEFIDPEKQQTETIQIQSSIPENLPISQYLRLILQQNQQLIDNQQKQIDQIIQNQQNQIPIIQPTEKKKKKQDEQQNSQISQASTNAQVSKPEIKAADVPPPEIPSKLRNQPPIDQSVSTLQTGSEQQQSTTEQTEHTDQISQPASQDQLPDFPPSEQMIPDVASSDLPMSMPPEDSTTEGTGRSRRKHGRGKKK